MEESSGLDRPLPPCVCLSCVIIFGLERRLTIANLVRQGELGGHSFRTRTYRGRRSNLVSRKWLVLGEEEDRVCIMFSGASLASSLLTSIIALLLLVLEG